MNKKIIIIVILILMVTPIIYSMGGVPPISCNPKYTNFLSDIRLEYKKKDGITIEIEHSDLDTEISKILVGTNHFLLCDTFNIKDYNAVIDKLDGMTLRFQLKKMLIENLLQYVRKDNKIFAIPLFIDISIEDSPTIVFLIITNEIKDKNYYWSWGGLSPTNDKIMRDFIILSLQPKIQIEIYKKYGLLPLNPQSVKSLQNDEEFVNQYNEAIKILGIDNQ